jgi:transposase
MDKPVVLITGVLRGIGRATALAFAAGLPGPRTRFMSGRGVSAASRPSNSIGSNGSAIVPSLHLVFRVRGARP